VLKDGTRIISIMAVAFELGLIVSFSTVAYSTLATLAATLQGQRSIEAKMDLDPTTGDGKINLSIAIGNRGLYRIYVGLRVRLLTDSGQQIAEGSDFKYIEPGEEGDLRLVLTLSRDEVEQLMVVPTKPHFVATFDFRTFFDLVSFAVDLEMMT
jgi:hypothetical protein